MLLNRIERAKSGNWRVARNHNHLNQDLVRDQAVQLQQRLYQRKCATKVQRNIFIFPLKLGIGRNSMLLVDRVFTLQIEQGARGDANAMLIDLGTKPHGTIFYSFGQDSTLYWRSMGAKPRACRISMISSDIELADTLSARRFMSRKLRRITSEEDLTALGFTREARSFFCGCATTKDLNFILND